MADRNVALELDVMARDLVGAAFTEVAADMEKVARTATEVSGRVGSAFGGTATAMSNALGNAVESLVSGGDIGSAAAVAGAYMAGQFAENFGGQAIERLTSSTLVGAIIAPMAGIGSTIGSALAAAIPIGMAAAPFLIIAAIAAAIAVLIVNEEIRNKVIGFAAGLVETLVGGLIRFLGALPGVIGKAFGLAWDAIVKSVPPVLVTLVQLWLTLPLRLAGLGLQIVQTIVGGLASLPGRMLKVIEDAIAGILPIDIGPFHITRSGFRIDAPSMPDLSGLVPHFASGTPFVTRDTFAVVHRGEAIIPAQRNPFAGHDLGSSAPGVVIQGVSEADIMRMVDRGLYFRLRRSAAVIVRS